jgi:murein L,D-transpeptidase YcbB/YkuD
MHNFRSFLFKFLILIESGFFSIVFAQSEDAIRLKQIINAGFANKYKVEIQGYSPIQVNTELEQFYASRAFEPFWLKSGKVTSKVNELISTILEVEEDGLNPNDYFLDRINNLKDSSNQIDLELLLTLSAVTLASDARFGRYRVRQIDSGSFKGNSAEPINIDPVFEELGQANDISDFISSQFPRHRQYQHMKEALADFREAAAEGGWPVMLADKPLKLGMSGARVLQLSNILRSTKDYDGDLKGQFDKGLLEAVKKFQSRHGIEETGEVHQKTYAALGIGIESRITTLLINMERWRFLARDFSPSKEIFVNIVGFELFAMEAGEVKLRSEVIVGKPYQSTPVFSDNIEYIEFNPYWNIPASIAASEILPKARMNPQYLDKEHIRIFPRSGEGELHGLNLHSISAKDYFFRQDYGEWNVLGKLKFAFPNPFNVYLHDTSSRDLFNKNTRAFSHGCIRVRDPEKLAVFILDSAEDPWDLDRVNQIIATSGNRHLRLREPVPINLTYRTAWVEKDGNVNFRDDLYGKDAAIRKSI